MDSAEYPGTSGTRRQRDCRNPGWGIEADAGYWYEQADFIRCDLPDFRNSGENQHGEFAGRILETWTVYGSWR